MRETYWAGDSVRKGLDRLSHLSFLRMDQARGTFSAGPGPHARVKVNYSSVANLGYWTKS